MNNFSLFAKKENSMPSALKVEGITYTINPDYRNILRIFALLKDNNVPEFRKTDLILNWFYAGEAPDNAYQEMFDFISPIKTRNEETEHESEESERQFDYEFDAEEIYSSFLGEYDIDLIEIPFLHWYKFRILLSNLPETSSFQRKISLRFLDLKDFKGQALIKAKKAKEAVQLPIEYTSEELKDKEAFENDWDKV